MSFLGRFRTTASTTAASPTGASTKKDSNAPPLSRLEKLIADAGPIKHDGSDKFFGLENFGSTCYANSVIQCLYYSAPFRDHVLNYPSRTPQDGLVRPKDTDKREAANALALRNKLVNPASPPTALVKAEENKDSPEYKKKQAMAAGPIVAMDWENCKRYGMTESLFTCLKDIFEAVTAHESRTGVVSPSKFLEILRRDNEVFRTPMHQDAHEFLNLLLNDVMESVEQFSKQTQEKSDLSGGTTTSASGLSKALTPIITQSSALSSRWVHELFEGTLTSETRCLTCENISQRDESFLDLSVDLSQHTSVTSCLRKFSEEEMLCERNKFHCDKCSGLQEAEKRMKIKRLPKILALHLKRFKYTEDFNRLHKLFHRVVYPFHLRLFNTTDDAEDPDRLYELYAVVVHIGGGPYHGHYVSIVKTQDRGWLLFDDEMVEPVDKSYVANFFGGEGNLACAYVLFYQQTTFENMQRELDAESAAADAAASKPSDLAREVSTPISPKANGILNGFSDPRQNPSISSSSTTAFVTPAFQPLNRAVTSPSSSGDLIPPPSAFDTPLAHSPTSPDPAPRHHHHQSPTTSRLQQRREHIHNVIDNRKESLQERRDERHEALATRLLSRSDNRSEKEAAKEAKTREKEQRRAEKEADKARRREQEELERKQKEQQEDRRKRYETMRTQQDEQLRAAIEAIEASKASKAAEDNSRTSITSRDALSSDPGSGGHANGSANGGPVGGPSFPPQTMSSEKPGGMLGRFRSTSISLKKTVKQAKLEAERESARLYGVPPQPQQQQQQQPQTTSNQPQQAYNQGGSFQDRPLPPNPPVETTPAPADSQPPSQSQTLQRSYTGQQGMPPPLPPPPTDYIPNGANRVSANGTASMPHQQLVPPPPAEPPKKEKFRFGLGRKKSMMYGGGS